MAKCTPIAGAKSNSVYFPRELYQRLADDLDLTGKAPRTRSGYLRAVRQLADFTQCSPEAVTEDQLRAFFLHSKNERNFANGSLRVALSGVKFFFTITCRRDWDTLSMLKLRNVTALPEVLTIDQVHQIVDAATTRRMQTFFWTVLKVIQKYMGHSSLATTLVYLHLTETAEADAREVIQTLFRRK